MDFRRDSKGVFCALVAWVVVLGAVAPQAGAQPQAGAAGPAPHGRPVEMVEVNRVLRDDPSASVCLVFDDDYCPVIGGVLRVVLELRAGDPMVSGGQFVFDYDPTGLHFHRALPGNACDPTSPFSTPLSLNVDEGNGQIFYAILVAPGDPGTQGPATVACLDFVVLGDPPGDVCLVPGDTPYVTRIVDGSAQPVPLDNSTECPAEPPALSCNTPEEVSYTCTCAVGTPDCSALDDDCNAGFCNETTGQCDQIPANEGGPCDDGSACTTDDYCVDGWCVGTDCTDQSLCLVIDDADCPVIDGIVNIALELSDGEPWITGGQFFIEYDPAAVQLHQALPGSACDPLSPFVGTLVLQVNEDAGEVFYAVTAAPGDPGTPGAATMACLSFRVLADSPSDICLTPGEDPTVTYLLDDLMQTVYPYNRLDCPTWPPSLSCDRIDYVSDVCTCDVGVPNCATFDDVCNVGICNEYTGRCERVPANEGDPCDDGNGCTVDDQCVNGFCVGSDCPDPSLCVVVEDGPFQVGSTMAVTVELGAGDPLIAGGQFLLEYDPAALQFADILPGSTCDPSSPFSNTLYLDVDEENGRVFYAVVTPDGAGTQEAATMACLSFTVIADLPGSICIISDNPQNTILVDDEGVGVGIDNGEDCPTFPPPISCDTYEFETVHVADLEVFYAGRFEDQPDPSRSFLASRTTATIDNMTNYIYGITGIRVFFDGIVEFATTPEAAFAFEWTTGTGTTFSPVTDAETAISITTEVQGDVTVATIILDDDHVRRRWLKVTIDAEQVSKGGVRLDGELFGDPVLFPSGDEAPGGDAVFYLGNIPGDVDGDRKVRLNDCGLVRAACNPFLPVPITNLYDVDKSGKVLLTDVGLTRIAVNPFFTLPLIEP